MNRLSQSFNIIFTLFLGTLLGGCASTTKKDVQYGLIQFHLEARPDGSPRTSNVPIFRASPICISIETDPILDVGYVSEASITEHLGSYEIAIQFDETGTRRLETITTVNRGRRLAIFARFMNDEIEHARWLGAPVIDQTIKDGRLSFTPDATREETQQLIDGLNAAAEEIKKPYVF